MDLTVLPATSPEAPVLLAHTECPRGPLPPRLSALQGRSQVSEMAPVKHHMSLESVYYGSTSMDGALASVLLGTLEQFRET